MLPGPLVSVMLAFAAQIAFAFASGSDGLGLGLGTCGIRCLVGGATRVRDAVTVGVE